MPKKSTKMERKLVAEKANKGSEIKSLASRRKIPIEKVRAAIAELKYQGKGWRSYTALYALLRTWGYKIKTRAFPNG